MKKGSNHSFQDTVFWSVIEYYIYQEYIVYLKDKDRFERPCFFYRHNELQDTFFSRTDGKLRNIDICSDIQIGEIQEIVTSLQKGGFDLAHFVKEYDSRYIFLLHSHTGKIGHPDNFSVEQLTLIESLFGEGQDNLYVLQGYVTYHYSRGRLDLLQYFHKILKMDTRNPFFLTILARYLGSALYKVDCNTQLLTQGRNYMMIAISEIEEEIPTYFYSWMGLLEHEIGNYLEAISLFEQVIKLNTKLGHTRSEPFIWKAGSLSKIGSNKDSQNVLKSLERNTTINDRKDFRFYRTMAFNAYTLKDQKDFMKYTKKSIEKYLNKSTFHLILFDEYHTLSSDGIQLHFNSYYSHCYESFLTYNKDYIKNHVDKVLFSIAFFCKEDAMGNTVVFKDSRGIERLAHLYLSHIYETRK